MLRYKTTKLTIPANQSKKETILTLPAEKKVILKGFGRTSESDCLSFIEIEGDRIVEIPCEFAINQGNFIPLEIEVAGPKSVEVGGEDVGGYDHTIYMTLAYEE
ncbi:MAG: hypothetical protein DRH57_04860 [Candidatus Cloacimonadota bacterium]|nr:MAG: hypothetical protein DRH57_04860 [Candidatus Cloacimonadota bacterium]